METGTTRKLASIQTISEIRDIPGADNIVMCQILGWECVINKKENFKVGDKVVYFEVDSILPEKPEFEFLRPRRFRIRTLRLRKQISQGLVMPLSILIDQNVNEGDDVTAILGVVKHDPQAREENEMNEDDTKHRSLLVKFLMKFAPFRYVYKKLNQKVKGNWPGWIRKTDETRLEVCASLLMNNYDQEWYITEKLDGCLDQDTILITKDGSKTIKEICENKYTGQVLAYNLITNKITYTKITNHSITENNNDWYEIYYNNKSIKLTGNHKVWLPELNCYREVKNLKKTDKILLNM